MSDSNQKTPDFREARHPSRVYRGTAEDGVYVVTVHDSSLPESERNPRVLLPVAVADSGIGCGGFRWGSEQQECLEFAIALLFDVCGDMDVALRWHVCFAESYVRRLPASWTIPELDIAFWLYCFQNARVSA